MVERNGNSTGLRRAALLISAVVLVGLLMVAVSAVSAATVLSNLSESPGFGYCVTSDYSVASGFTVPAGADYTLDSVTLKLASASGSQTISVSLWSATALGQPDAQLSVIGQQAVTTTSFDPYQFTPASTITLTADTTYFLVPSLAVSGCAARWGVGGSAPAGTFTYAFTFDTTLGSWENQGRDVVFQVDASEVVILPTQTNTAIPGTATATPPPTATALPPPPVPLCEEHNFDESGVVRSSLNDASGYAINCRVLYQNGSPTTWLGKDQYGSGSLGIDGLLSLGVQQAVDIFSPPGLTSFEGGAVFCLRGEGTLIWLPASGIPRHAEIIGSYTVPDFPGFTCATLFEPGTLILVEQNPVQ